MADRVLVTTDDLEYAVRVNGALEAAGFTTAMVTSFDDARDALTAHEPDCLVVTGALHEPSTGRLLTAARDRAVSTAPRGGSFARSPGPRSSACAGG